MDDNYKSFRCAKTKDATSIFLIAQERGKTINEHFIAKI